MSAVKIADVRNINLENALNVLSDDSQEKGDEQSAIAKKRAVNDDFYKEIGDFKQRMVLFKAHNHRLDIVL